MTSMHDSLPRGEEALVHTAREPLQAFKLQRFNFDGQLVR